MANQLIVRYLGRQAYQSCLQKMQQFTDSRTATTCDEIWLLEHEPVYTQGQAGKAEHLLVDTHIPVIHADRGGQITYHGPGQLIAYLLLDLKRLKISVRGFVNLIENNLVKLLADWGIAADVRPGAPGVYVADAKIASLGIRIRKGSSFHGLALNVDMDLGPFAAINPCGYAGLSVTQMQDHVAAADVMCVAEQLVAKFQQALAYPEVEIVSDSITRQ